MSFEKECLYLPLAPEDTDRPKSPNVKKSWDGPTIKSWGSEGRGCYTWGERQEEDWDRWGVVDVKDDDKRLLILDFDIYDMEDKRKKKMIQSFNERAPKTRVHKSKNNGFHLFYIVDKKNLDAEFDEDGEVQAKLPVKLGKNIDDKLNGYVVDPGCEGYEVHIEKEPAEINPRTDLLEEWLNGETDEDDDTVQSEKLDDEEMKKRLETALEEDEKFKKLYNGKYKKAGFGDRSSAEASLAAKIGYWFGRNEENIKKVMDSSKAEKWQERNDSSYRNSIISVGLQGDEEYKGNDNKISEELKKEIRKRIEDPDKLSWNCKTKFITFTTEIEFEDDKIEWGDTYELPEDLAEELVEDKKASYGIWKCSDCKQNYYQENKPYVCRNEDEEKHKATYDFIPLHPSKPHEIGDVLLENYRFATPGESITESKPGKVHIYEDGIYHNPGSMAAIRGKVKQMMHESQQETQKHVINHITTLEYVPEEEFGLDENEVVIEDGILDLDELEVRPHDPDKLALSKIPTKYDPEADCPKFKQFLKETIPSEKNRDLVQEVLGTALINKKIHKRGVMIPGPTDAGKSTFCDIIRNVIGEDSCGNHTPKSIADSNWARAKLRDLLLNISDETSSGKIYRTERLKKALDGNPMQADEKYSAIFEFKPTCEHIYGTNMTPTVSRSDEAFWNRWIVAPTRSDSVPEDEQNKKLVSEILEDEKSGILNWIIDGYKRYMDGEEGFTRDIVWTDERDKWLKFGDSVQRFIQNCLCYEEGNKVKASDLHDAYREYVNQNDTLELDNQRTLTKEVKKLSYCAYSTKYRFDGKQSSGFKHIGLKEDCDFGTFGGTNNQTQRYDEKNKNNSDDNKGSVNNTPNSPKEQGKIEDLGVKYCEECLDEMGIEKKAERKVNVNGGEKWLCEGCLKAGGFDE